MGIVKVTRNGKQAEVVERYLPEFLKDGWKEVKNSKSGNEQGLDNQAIGEKLAEEEQEREVLAAKARIKEDEERAMAIAKNEQEVKEYLEEHQPDPTEAHQKSVEAARKKHMDHVLAAEDKDTVVEYIKETFDEDIDKRGSLDTVKEKAKAVINESERVD